MFFVDTAVAGLKSRPALPKCSPSKVLARFLQFTHKQVVWSAQLLRQEMAKISQVMDLLEAGLRAETLRQRVIAGNVANIETPGYRRADVKFEQALAKAIESGGDIDPEEIKAEIYRPRNTTVKTNGNDVTLEAEVGQMVKNTLKHKAYTRLLQKKYAQLEQAMNIK